MITRTIGYSANGKHFPELKDAQIEEIDCLLRSKLNTPLTIEELAPVILQFAAQMVDILTTTPTSKPTARKVNGATRKRKSKGSIVQPEALA